MKTVKSILKVSTAVTGLFLLLSISGEPSKAQCCMMMGHGNHTHSGDTDQNTSVSDTTKTGQAFYYTCSMHPEIRADVPGNCPKCGMTLVKTASGEKPKSKMMGMMNGPMGILMLAMMVVMIAGGMAVWMGR